MKFHKPPAAKEDADWLAEISDIKPLGSKGPAPSSAKPSLPKVPLVSQPAPRITSRHEFPPIPVLSNTDERIAGLAPHLGKDILKDLSRGRIIPTAVVDLHGLGEGDAWLEVMDFLHASASADHRCALIIHGKGRGYGPNGTMGVIKYQIAGWLAGHPRVLAFHTALPEHGGTGAIYVYLHRHL